MLFSYNDVMLGSILILCKDDAGPTPISLMAETCAVETLYGNMPYTGIKVFVRSVETVMFFMIVSFARITICKKIQVIVFRIISIDEWKFMNHCAHGLACF